MFSLSARWALIGVLTVLSVHSRDLSAQATLGHEMHGMNTGPLGIPMDRMGSGTTWIPDAVSLPSRSRMLGSWNLMLHGFGFLQYDYQSGDRGDSQFGSLNWAMLMLSRDSERTRLQFRTMISLDPGTVTPRGYPLLLQTGESFNGEPLRDRQHPHDFFMEVAASYDREVVPSLGVSFYAAASGEPALNPVAFMHRPSAMDDPVAPLGHHWMDATHITYGVLTAGLFTTRWKIEGSVFNGREPDEERWGFDRLRLNSYSGRLTVNPDSNWSASIGYGYLNSPEILHPDESMHRITAGILNGRKLGTEGQWATTIAAGANKHLGESRWTVASLIESEAILDKHNTVMGRVEVVTKSAEDLVLPETGPNAVDRTELFDVASVSLGYIREVARWGGATAGIGLRGTVTYLPAELEAFYGSRAPLGVFVFFRVRPFHRASMPGMQHQP